MRQLQMDFITNPVSARWIQILNIIEQKPSFTLMKLSERLGVSQRTLLKDTQGIKEYFGESIGLYSKQSGFKFEIVDHILYMEKKSDIVESEILFDLIGKIFYGEKHSVQELADEYSYAESTLRRFLTRTEKTLATYGLSFSYTPVSLIGDEGSIRKFLFDFYYSGEHTSHTICPPENLHSLVFERLSNTLGHYEIGSGAPPSMAYFLLYLVINRVKQNQLISIPSWVKTKVVKEKDFQLLYSLQNDIAKEFNVMAPIEEFIWIYIILISQRTMNHLDQEQIFFERFNQDTLTRTIAESYFSNSKFDGWDRKNLENYLAAFLVSKTLLQSIHPVWNKQQVEEFEMVEKKHGKAFRSNKQFLLKYRKKLNFEGPYFEDIIISFTLFSELLFKVYQPKKKVLFLVEGDSLVTQALRHEAYQRLGNQHHLLFFQLNDLVSKRINSEKIDLIITNYRPYLINFESKRDYVLVNTVPNETDWSRVQVKLNKYLDPFCL